MQDERLINSEPAASEPPTGGLASGTTLGEPAVGLDAESWRRVSQVTERMAASNDLADLLALIIDSMRDCLRADRASVFQYDQRRQELFINTAHGLREIRFPITKGIAGEAARKLGIINVPDCYADARFNPEIDKATGYRTRNMLTIPLVSFDGGLEGVAQVLNKDPARGACFDDADESIARHLAAQAAIAIRRARFIESEARKRKIEADLAVARNIQQSTFPKVVPQVAGYEIAGHSLPAEETGGDAFDLVDLESLCCGVVTPGREGGPTGGPSGGPSGGPEGLLAGTEAMRRGVVFVVGDATGHGIGPALSVAQFRSMVRMGVRLGADLTSIMVNLNSQLCDDLPAGRFVTAFLGRLDPLRHEIVYCSAGQAPLLVVRADGGVEERDATGLPLGIDADMGYDEVEPFRLGPGDVFLVLSDGYFEAMNPSDEQYGVGRVVDVVRECRGLPAQSVLDAVGESVRAFAAGRPFDDDQTAVVVRRQ